MTTTEPEWDPDQQTLMLALGEYRAQVCDGCGGWLPETTDPANQGTYVATPILCHQCEGVGDARDAFVQGRTKAKSKIPHALNRWRVRRKG